MLISSHKISHHFLTTNGKRLTSIYARKEDSPQNLETNNKKPNFEFKLSSKLLAQSAIAVSGLGFVDAGYSGDWSRIGVISTGTEDLLKIAAFLVVPLCLFLIYSLSTEQED